MPRRLGAISYLSPGITSLVLLVSSLTLDSERENLLQPLIVLFRTTGWRVYEETEKRKGMGDQRINHSAKTAELQPHPPAHLLMCRRVM